MIKRMKISYKTKALTAIMALTALMTACGADYTKIVSEPERKFYMGQPLEAARCVRPDPGARGGRPWGVDTQGGARLGRRGSASTSG